MTEEPQTLCMPLHTASGPAYFTDTDINWLIAKANAGMSYRDMAEGLNRPMGTVKNMLFRLRRDGLVARRYIDWTSKELPCD